MKSEPSTATEQGNAPVGIAVKPMLHTQHLEQLIDAYGLPRILETLSDIAHDKADHVQANWQDEALAKEWTAIGAKLANLGSQIPRL